jgi:hypothetical protein
MGKAKALYVLKGTGEKLSVRTVPVKKKGYVKCHALRALEEAVGDQSFFGKIVRGRTIVIEEPVIYVDANLKSKREPASRV